MPLREQAENIRARIERVVHDAQAMDLRKEDQDKGVPATRLGMRLQTASESETEIINLGIVMGTDSKDEHGTVLISRLLVKWDELGNSVEANLTRVEILGGRRFKIWKDVDYLGGQQGKSRGYSVVYPQPARAEFGQEAIVANGEGARILLQQIGFAVDRCLTQPNSLFYRQRSKPFSPSAMERVGR
ncbi:hypothetical protein HYS96_00215 [Candidatus Daviesbacteria bacterium]|nr:hypothetical protein [Candidatus Daviesbacteria bacterium]